MESQEQQLQSTSSPEISPSKSAQDDVEDEEWWVLIRKLSKCDRLLEKKGPDHKDTPKVQQKRKGYLQRLGELAYERTMSTGSSQIHFEQTPTPAAGKSSTSGRSRKSSKKKKKRSVADGSHAPPVSQSDVVKEELTTELQQEESNVCVEEDDEYIYEEITVDEEEEELEIDDLVPGTAYAGGAPAKFEDSLAVFDTSISELPNETGAGLVGDSQPIPRLVSEDKEVSTPPTKHETERRPETPKVVLCSIPGDELVESPQSKKTTENAPESPEGSRGSVSHLRAMFDSPPPGNVKRNWKPLVKDDAKAMGPAQLDGEAAEGTKKQEVPSPAVLRKAVATQDRPTSSQLDGETAEGTAKPMVLSPALLRKSRVPTKDTSAAQALASVELVDEEAYTLPQETPGTIIALITLYPDSLYEQGPKQKRTMNIFKAIGVEPRIVDGADPKERLRRNALFELSGKRGHYPQFFVTNNDGETKFFGDFEALEVSNDCGTLAAAIEKIRTTSG